MIKLFQGHVCKKCDNTLRYVKDKRCVQCRRKWYRAREKTPKRREREHIRQKTPKRRELQANLRAIGYHRKWQHNAHHADPRKRMLKKARERAKMYGREITITVSDIIIPEKCPLLGISLFVGNRQVKNNSPTIDRKDSTKGYTPDNVWVISWRANRIKSDATPEELKLIIKNWELALLQTRC